MNIYDNNFIKEDELYCFLKSVKDEFPIPLDYKTDLKLTAHKLYHQGDLIYAIDKEDNSIMGLIGGYNNNNNKGYISIVVLKKEYRGKGIAKKLISKFLDKSKSNGMDKVWLFTHSTNTVAIKMYESLGFKREGLNEKLDYIYSIDINQNR